MDGRTRQARQAACSIGGDEHGGGGGQSCTETFASIFYPGVNKPMGTPLIPPTERPKGVCPETGNRQVTTRHGVRWRTGVCVCVHDARTGSSEAQWSVGVGTTCGGCLCLCLLLFLHGRGPSKRPDGGAAYADRSWVGRSKQGGG